VFSEYGGVGVFGVRTFNTSNYVDERFQEKLDHIIHLLYKHEKDENINEFFEELIKVDYYGDFGWAIKQLKKNNDVRVRSMVDNNIILKLGKRKKMKMVVIRLLYSTQKLMNLLGGRMF